MEFVKVPEHIIEELFSKNSPMSEKVRVFTFIQYRIQKNKRRSQSENITREYILQKTGINPGNFSRIIKTLVKEKLIEVEAGKYRDSAATYRINRERFGAQTVSFDLPKKNQEKVVNKSMDKNVDNFKMKFGNNGQLQIEEPQLQSEVETDASGLKPQEISALRFLLTRALKENLRASEKPKESFTLLGAEEKKRQRTWFDQTQGLIPYDQWISSAWLG